MQKKNLIDFPGLKNCKNGRGPDLATCRAHKSGPSGAHVISFNVLRPLEAPLLENRAAGAAHLPWPSALSQFEERSTTESGTMEEPLPGEEVLEPDAEATPELEAEQAPGALCEEELGAGQVADGADVATEALEPAEEESEARPVADGAGVATEEQPEPAAAPSPARAGGAVIMSCGIRTRDGDSLLVRFVNHEGWLEARALDCSGGNVGRVVLCGLADDDAAAQRRLCEDLAPRLIVRDGALALGEAPVVEAPAPALAEAPAPAPSSRRRRRRSTRAGAGARSAAAEAPAPAAEAPMAPTEPAEPPVESAPVPLRKVRFANTFQSGRFGAIDAVDGARAGGANAFGFGSVEYDDEDPTSPVALVRRDSAAWRVAELAAMRASIALTRAKEASSGANLAHHRDNRSMWTGLVATASAKAKWKALSKRKSRVTALPPARSYDTTPTMRRRQRDREAMKRWWAADAPPWEREVTAALAVRTAPAPLMRVPRPASAAVDIGAIAAAAVPRLRPKTAPVPRQSFFATAGATETGAGAGRRRLAPASPYYGRASRGTAARCGPCGGRHRCPSTQLWFLFLPPFAPESVVSAREELAF